jgi:5-methylthioadenosine/S-adenosylhomocysteine deaminase
VGHEAGHHRLIREGVVVYEGNTILHVGKSFDGPVDNTINATGKLVAPGFIDTHVHSGHRATHRLITDTGRPMYYGQPFLEISVPKEGALVKGDPRYLKHGDAGSEAAFALNATFTVAELLRNGVTTFVEFGSQLKVQDALLAEVIRLGTRVFLAPGYDCGRWVGDEKGRLKRVTTSPVSVASRLRSTGSKDSTAPPAAGCAASCARARSKHRASNCCGGHARRRTPTSCRWRLTPPTA